jgi:hypothetical protein
MTLHAGFDIPVVSVTGLPQSQAMFQLGFVYVPAAAAFSCHVSLPLLEAMHTVDVVVPSFSAPPENAQVMRNKILNHTVGSEIRLSRMGDVVVIDVTSPSENALEKRYRASPSNTLLVIAHRDSK